MEDPDAYFSNMTYEELIKPLAKQDIRKGYSEYRIMGNYGLSRSKVRTMIKKYWAKNDPKRKK